MTFSRPASLPRSDSVVAINAVAVLTQSLITLGKFDQTLTLQQVMTGKGKVVVEGRIVADAPFASPEWVQLPIEGQRGGAGTTTTTTGKGALSQVNSNGIYYYNVAGMTQVRITATPVSGTISVAYTLSRHPVPNIVRRRVNNRVAEDYQRVIAAGATTTVFSAFDRSQWPFIGFAFRSEVEAGGWRTLVEYAPVYNRALGGGSGNGSPEGWKTALDTTDGGGEFLPTLISAAEILSVRIKNFDAVDHTYDSWITGVG